MSTLHFFEKHLVAKVAVEGGDVVGACGTAVRPTMQNGHVVEFYWRPGDTVCVDCVLRLQVVRPTPSIRKRYAETLALAPKKEERES